MSSSDAGHERRDVARAGAHRRLGREARRAGQPARAAGHEHVAGGELRRRGAAARDERVRRAASISPTSACTGAPRGIPMSMTSHLAGVLLARRDPQPGLGGGERRRGVARAPPRRATSPVEASTPLGDVGGHDGAPSARRSPRSRPAPRSRGSPSKPVPRIASTIDRGAVERVGRERARARPRRRREVRRPRRRGSSAAPASSRTRTSRPASRSRRAGDEPVAAVVALAADDRDRARAARRRSTSQRQARPRALHEVQRRDRRAPRSPSGRSARICSAPWSGSSQSGSAHAHRTTATAPAVALECVSEIVDLHAELRQRRRAARRAVAAPSPTTSMSCGLHASRRSALATASLAQKRAARCWPGRARRAAYARSPSVNSRSREAAAGARAPAPCARSPAGRSRRASGHRRARAATRFRALRRARDALVHSRSVLAAASPGLHPLGPARFWVGSRWVRWPARCETRTAPREEGAGRSWARARRGPVGTSTGIRQPRRSAGRRLWRCVRARAELCTSPRG